MLWAFLFGGLLLAAVAGLCFLIHSARRFRWVAALSHGRKAASIGIGAAAILLPSALIGLVWGYMNAIVILLHLAVFWLMAEGIQRLIQRCRKQPFRRYYAGGRPPCWSPSSISASAGCRPITSGRPIIP